MKKGQAAMEFLMTYGWAILVVLAAIGALAYFGVLSPGKLLPERTVFKAPVPNIDNAVVRLSGTTAMMDIAFRNNKGGSITITEGAAEATFGSADDCSSATGPVGLITGYSNPIANGEVFIIEVNCTTTKTVGDKFKADITFNYVSADTSQSRPHSGSVDAELLP